MLHSLWRWWTQLRPRERRGVAAATAVVLGAAAVQLLYSALLAQEDLTRQLAREQTRLARMQALAAEWRGLQSAPPPPPVADGAALDAALRNSLQALNESFTLRFTGARRLQVSGEAPFDEWLAWMAQLRAQQRLRLVRGVFTSSAQAGVVRIEAEFAE